MADGGGLMDVGGQGWRGEGGWKKEKEEKVVYWKEFKWRIWRFGGR
jgi:hypothetical protein